MAKTSPKLTWCKTRIGDDMNWWVEDISDSVHWDTDGLGIIDPRQFQHLLELMDSLQDYGLQTDFVEDAFFPFAIDKVEKDKSLLLKRIDDSILENEEQLFALPDIIDEEKGPYADLLDHLTKLRVKMLNDLIDFSQKLTIEELEEEIREAQNVDFIEGKPSHFFNELTAILEYVPQGFELDSDDDDAKDSEEDITDDIPEIDDADEKIEKDETMKWDEDEEEDDFDSDDTPPSTDEDLDDDDDDEKPSKR